jgi:hypothetical protein
MNASGDWAANEHGVGPADHLAVAEVDAVELADGDPARSRAHVMERGDVH